MKKNQRRQEQVLKSSKYDSIWRAILAQLDGNTSLEANSFVTKHGKEHAVLVFKQTSCTDSGPSIKLGISMKQLEDELAKGTFRNPFERFIPISEDNGVLPEDLKKIDGDVSFVRGKLFSRSTGKKTKMPSDDHMSCLLLNPEDKGKFALIRIIVNESGVDDIYDLQYYNVTDRRVIFEKWNSIGVMNEVYLLVKIDRH